MLESLTSAKETGRGGLGRRLGLALGVAFALVLLVGGISLLSAWSIWRSTEEIRRQGEHIEIMDGVHATLHHVAAAVRDALLTARSDLPDAYPSLIRDLRVLLARYEELERAAEDFPEKEREDRIYQEISRTVKELIPLSARMLAAFREGRRAEPADLERLSRISARMPAQAREMNDIHQIKIRRLIRDGQERMWLILGLYLAFVIVGSAVIVVGSRVVSRTVVTPLRDLAAATLEVARGDLGRRVPVRSGDEIGQLSGAFNVMAERLEEHEGHLREAHQRLERKARETEVLYLLGTEISALLHVDRVMESVVTKARELWGADTAGLALVDEEKGEVAWKLFQGGTVDGFKAIRLRPGEGIAGRVVSTGQPVVIEDITAGVPGGLDAYPILNSEGLRSCLAVPLLRGLTVIGVLFVGIRQPSRYTEDRVTLLRSLANQAAVAIENARLYDQTRRVATLEERERIAREIHDGLAQVLGLMLLKLRAGPLASLGEADLSASRAVADLERLAQQAYQEVRHSILGLRTLVSRSLGLIPTLAEYLHEFSEQTGIRVDLQVVDEAAIRFSPDAEVQLIRIIQEALANVARHAGAARASVAFEPVGELMRVTVADEGKGFDPTQAGRTRRGSFGLQSMRERATAAGGRLEIESAPEKGTRVIVTLAPAA